ncbi:Uu.00g107540.m01.CDS01 [Anthostomella pinea]|uniref:Uu.00g107540.m01.CDS01 n=1 Tax=Anthostomella pinea TaxID=933095 RepID=A0AAI8YG48_9PEZI|nr:Uu.00g107540.m01.CDS01 [Anthostomella pinea]
MDKNSQPSSSDTGRVALYLTHAAERLLKSILPERDYKDGTVTRERKSPDYLPYEARGLVSPEISSVDSDDGLSWDLEEYDIVQRNNPSSNLKDAKTDPDSNKNDEDRAANDQIDKLEAAFKPTLETLYGKEYIRRRQGPDK